LCANVIVIKKVGIGLEERLFIQGQPGNTVVSGLTAGLAGQGADITLSNTNINAGQVVLVQSMKITGA
jgi:hypothetical protein